MYCERVFRLNMCHLLGLVRVKVSVWIPSLRAVFLDGDTFTSWVKMLKSLITRRLHTQLDPFTSKLPTCLFRVIDPVSDASNTCWI